MITIGSGSVPARRPVHCPSWIATRAIAGAAHSASRRSELPALLARLRAGEAKASVAIEAALDTRKVAILELVLASFAAEARGLVLYSESVIEKMDKPIEAALALVYAGVDLAPIIKPIARLALREAEGKLMAALLHRERDGSLVMDPSDFQPYMLSAEPVPYRDWMASRPKPVLDDILRSALLWGAFPVVQVALALGASCDTWSSEQLATLRERIASARYSPRSRSFDELHGDRAADTLIELALGTATAHGRIAAKRRYPDINRLLRLSS